ncbi:MAG: hypothetical protein ACLP8B_21880 [Xanthobacteraceae bacterium]
MQQGIKVVTNFVQKDHVVLAQRPIVQKTRRSAPVIYFAGSCQSELKRTLRRGLGLAVETPLPSIVRTASSHLPGMVNAKFPFAVGLWFRKCGRRILRRRPARICRLHLANRARPPGRPSIENLRQTISLQFYATCDDRSNPGFTGCC